PGERVLATAATDDAAVVITSRRLVVPGDLDEGKPWHLVDAGRWDPESSLLTVTWVDRTPPGRWHLTEPGGVPDAFHERVGASVVLVEQAGIDRTRRARVVLGRDSTAGRATALSGVAKGFDPDDPELVAGSEEDAACLFEEVGREALPRFRRAPSSCYGGAALRRDRL